MTGVEQQMASAALPAELWSVEDIEPEEITLPGSTTEKKYSKICTPDGGMSGSTELTSPSVRSLDTITNDGGETAPLTMDAATRSQTLTALGGLSPAGSSLGGGDENGSESLLVLVSCKSLARGEGYSMLVVLVVLVVVSPPPVAKVHNILRRVDSSSNRTCCGRLTSVSLCSTRQGSSRIALWDHPNSAVSCQPLSKIAQNPAVLSCCSITDDARPHPQTETGIG